MCFFIALITFLLLFIALWHFYCNELTCLIYSYYSTLFGYLKNICHICIDPQPKHAYMLNINLEEYLDNKDLDKAVELYSLISEERLKVRDTGVNYRTINHWDDHGLIRFTKNSAEGKRRFSFVDFLWIKIIDELRTFGVGIPVIKKITDEIYEPLPFKELMKNLAENITLLSDFQGEVKKEFVDFLSSGEYLKADFSDLEFNYLHILVTEVISSQKPIFLVVFKDGEWLPFFKEKENLYPKDLLHKMDYHSQVRISITDLIFSIITEDSMLPYAEKMNVFDNQEKELIAIIKKGAYKKVHVLFKSKKTPSLEIIKNKKALQQLIGIFRQKEYREFILTTKKDKEIRIKQMSI